jgi:Tol biopolymer transport system component
MVRLTMGMGPESQPSVARSGVGLAYSTYEQQSSIIVVDLTSGARGTLPTDDVVTDIGISPDGREIAYVSDREGSRGLWVQAIAELTPRGPPRRLTQLPGALARPTYSPDGRWIAVHRAIDGQRDIWVLAAAGGLPHPITTDPAVDIQPAWSPDGAHLAFVSDRSGHRQVWVVPVADGHPAGPPREITHDALPKDLPAWSPDGAEISYRAGEGRESEIWTAPISGASARRITTGAVAYAARWEGRTGALLVAGTWGARFPTLRRVRLADGQSTPMNPEITFGNVDDAIFEVALDGRTAVIDFEISRGDVWMLDAPKGEAY